MALSFGKGLTTVVALVSSMVMVLLSETVKIEPNFGNYRALCEELSDFAVDVRYPGGISEPPEGEAERFVEAASNMLSFVKRMLSL